MATKSTSRLAIQMTLDGVSAVLGGARSVVGGIGSIGGALRKMSQDVFYGLSNLRMLQDLAAKPIEIITSVVQANASRETAILQFETLLKSADAAKDMIKQVSKFAAETPFEMPEILNAARTLQTFGKSALNNKQVMTSIGDAAAGTGKSFEEVAYWTGRMYASLSSGQPFAEAINRFTEMGAIGPEVAATLRKISDEGQGTAETIKLLFQGMDKEHAGGMKKLSDSFKGMMSTLSDAWNEFKILVGEELFEAMKADLVEVRSAIDQAFESGQAQMFAANVGKALRGLYDEVKDSIFGVLSLDDIVAAMEQGRIGAVLSEQFKVAVLSMEAALLDMASRVGRQMLIRIVKDSMTGGYKSLMEGQEEGRRIRQDVMPRLGGEVSDTSSLGQVRKERERQKAEQERAMQELMQAREDGTEHLLPPEFYERIPKSMRPEEAAPEKPAFFKNMQDLFYAQYEKQRADAAEMSQYLGMSAAAYMGPVRRFGSSTATDTDRAVSDKLTRTNESLAETERIAAKMAQTMEQIANQPALLYGR